MYSLYKEQDKVIISVFNDLPLRYFPIIDEPSYFDKTVEKKFMLLALKKTSRLEDAKVVIKNINNVSMHNVKQALNRSKMKRVLFSANYEDLVFYTKLFDERFNMCPIDTLKFEPIDFELPQMSFERVFFSSKRAFEFFVQKVGLRILWNKKIIAVGKKTALAIEKYGFAVEYPDVYSAKNISLKDTLIICPIEHAKYKEGFVLPVYKTLCADDLEFYNYDGEFDFAIITSPKSLECITKKFDYLSKTKQIICIGSTTAKIIENLGYSCIIPKEFTIEAIFKMLEELN